MKKIPFYLSAISAALLCALVLAGCESNPVSPDESSQQPVTTEAPAKALPAFADAEWRVVRSETASQDEIDAAVSITKAFTNAFDKMPELTTDFIKRDAEYDSTTYEILVGRTANPETQQMLASLGMGDWAVCAVGNKIVVTAWSDLGVTLAANELSKMFKNGLTTFTDENTVQETFNAMLNLLPAYDGGTMAALAAMGDRAYQLVTEKTTAEEWQTYRTKLADAGYALSGEREAAGNTFAIYRGDRYGITTYFTPFNHTARAIIEPVENLGPVWDVAAEAGEKICTPKLIMIGRKFGTTETFRGAPSTSGLMCYVLRLEDGRFLVVDGGVQSGGFAAAIMQTLRDQAPDPKQIEIAAWIITHTHNDHTGGFSVFCQTYSNQANIRCVMLNFPAEADVIAHADSGGKSWVATVVSAYRNAYPKGTMIKVHNGYACSFGGADIEFLYSPEDYLTSAQSLSTTKNWNNTSLIFRVNIAGDSIMFLGDSQVDSNNITTAMYGDYLRANIVQVAHHGGVGGTAAIYNCIDPAVALFTTSDELMEVYLGDSHNHHLVNNIHLVEYINADDRITEFALPYTPGTSVIIPG